MRSHSGRGSRRAGALRLPADLDQRSRSWPLSEPWHVPLLAHRACWPGVEQNTAGLEVPALLQLPSRLLALRRWSHESLNSADSPPPVLALLPATAGVLSGNCRTADQPAATLLIPYFEVDLRERRRRHHPDLGQQRLGPARPWPGWSCGPTGASPTLAFDVYLTGYDVQSLNLRDLFQGRLPATTRTVSPHGGLSDASTAFPGCGDGQTQGTTGVSPAGWTTSRPPTPAGRCPGAARRGAWAAAARAPRLATGYITVDVVNRCTPRQRGQAGEHARAIRPISRRAAQASRATPTCSGASTSTSTRAQNQAESQPAVHIVADADTFSAGGLHVLRPLCGLRLPRRPGAARPASTTRATWTAAPSPAAGPGGLARQPRGRRHGSDCGTRPSWAPLGEFQLVAFDEEENPTEIPQQQRLPARRTEGRTSAATRCPTARSSAG